MAAKEEVKHLEDCSVAKGMQNSVLLLHLSQPWPESQTLPFFLSVFGVLVFSALGTWFFSVAGALVAIPVGIKRKSLGPLVFFGTTGTMLDIIVGVSQCERENAERQAKLLEAQDSLADASYAEGQSES